jgi:hypothetical protein
MRCEKLMGGLMRTELLKDLDRRTRNSLVN